MLKSLERHLKKLWIRLLTGLMRSPKARPDWGSRPHKLLFLRHDRLGDMIVSTGEGEAAERHLLRRCRVLLPDALMGSGVQAFGCSGVRAFRCSGV